MKRTTIFLDEQIERDLRAVARRQRRPVAAVVREALAAYVVEVRQQQKTHALSFVGVGASGRHDVAERHEELLFADLDPHGVPKPAGPSPAPAARSRTSAERSTTNPTVQRSASAEHQARRREPARRKGAATSRRKPRAR